MHKLLTEKIGPSTIDFAARSYVALKKGKRTWLPMWPRTNGAYVYIPGGPSGAVDQPSDFFAKVKEELAPLGIEPSWSFKYNAGANPIAFPITFQHATHSKVVEILEQAYALARIASPVNVVQRKLHPGILTSGRQPDVKPSPLGPRLWRLRA
jgi:hypothetical protein